MGTEKTTTAIMDVRKYEQKIIFGQELPTFPEDYKLPDSYYLHLPKDTLFSLADYAAKVSGGSTK